MPEVKLVSYEDILEMINGLPSSEKEKLAAAILNQLPTESKTRLMNEQMGDSGLVVILGGSNCISVHTDIALQIQNAQNVDMAEVMEALAHRMKSERRRRSESADN